MKCKPFLISAQGKLMRKFGVLSAVVLSLLIGISAEAQEKPMFPRIGGMNIGGPQDYEKADYQQRLARLDVSVITIWPDWEKGRNTTMEQVVRNIKAINPNIKVLLYLNNNELYYPNTASAWIDKLTAIEANRWWLYTNSTVGTMVKSTWQNDFYTINTTLHATKNAQGHTWVEWFARWAVDMYYKPNPSIDGFYLDNVFWKPRVDGDWNRDGVVDKMNDPATRAIFRQGLRRHFDVMKQLMPGKYQLGNYADWGASAAEFPELNKQMHGGFMEFIVGLDSSPESWGGWSEMMRWYRKTMAAGTEPNFAIFNQQGDPTNYQAFRYGFASCLLDDAYYSFSTLPPGKTHAPYNDTAWFDEYDVDLGEALTGPVMQPWSQGVYRRDFRNGIVLVNPKGNGAKTVQLEEEFRRVAGAQDPAVNSGQLTRSVTLKDRDGIVLLRKVVAVRPKPPQNIGVQ